MNKRNEVLRATAKAAELIDGCPEYQRPSFDIVRLVTDMDIPLLFRPLDKLLGSVVTIGSTQGILVTTSRDLHVQRFTIAHELGHILLGHPFSLDRSVGILGAIGIDQQSAEEIAANTFASELLASKHLVLAIAKSHEWTVEKLRQPTNLYQLSLRLGISYEATCWALASSRIFTRAVARSLANTILRDVKRTLAPANLISNPWANVWALTSKDSGAFLEAEPDDIYALRVQDNASAGFLWRLIDTGSTAQLIGEESATFEDAYGQASSRVMYIRMSEPGICRLLFEHKRPWSESRIDSIEIEVSGYGKESPGLARRAKLEALEVE